MDFAERFQHHAQRATPTRAAELAIREMASAGPRSPEPTPAQEQAALPPATAIPPPPPRAAPAEPATVAPGPEAALFVDNDDEPVPAPPRPGTAAGADKLRIAKRIRLDPGEELTGSDKCGGDGGSVRWALVRRPDGTAAVRLGAGGEAFASREDAAGPWTAGPDPSAQMNADRKLLSDEKDRIDDRLAGILAAEQIATVRAANQDATYADLVAERARVIARLDEIVEHDMKVNRARGRALDGEQVDPAELEPPPYCEPGEYDRLKSRMHELAGLPDPRVWPQQPAAAEPGEEAALNRRFDELEDMSLGEVWPSGFTARLDQEVLHRAVDDIAAAVDRAEPKCRAGLAWWDRYDQIEAGGDEQALADYKATEPAMDYEIFAEGRVPGEWGDLAYMVDLDEYASGVRVRICIVPHGSDTYTDLDEVSAREAACTLTTPQALKMIRALRRQPPRGV